MPYYKISNKDLNPQELLLEILASMTVVPKERKVMLNHIPASQQCLFIRAEGLAGELLESETFCFAFSHQCQTELPGSWPRHADYNHDNAEVNTDRKVSAWDCNLEGHLARKHTKCNLFLSMVGNECWRQDCSWTETLGQGTHFFQSASKIASKSLSLQQWARGLKNPGLSDKHQSMIF